MIARHFLHKSQIKKYDQLLVTLGMCFLLILSSSNSLKAQNNTGNSLQSLTVAQRSDDKGHVVRFHFSQAVDSFEVYQPNIDLIQMTLYSKKIDTTDIGLPKNSSIYDEISFYDIPGGIGVDIYITKGKYFEGEAYHDAKSEDLLLGLTKSNKSDLKYITKDLEPLIWSRMNMAAGSLLVNNKSGGTVSDTNYEKFKHNMQFDVVVLDPGHGGYDPGSIGYKGIKEKNLVMKVAKKVGSYIKENLPEVKVVYTRKTDKYVGLKERGSIANRAKGDLFISIHANSFSNRQVHGTEVYFLGLEKTQSALKVMKRENQVVQADSDTQQKKLTQKELLIYELANSGYIANSQGIAGMFEHQFDDRAKRRSRGVKQARFMVLYHASMPAVLLETGFISNPSEGRYLTSDYGQTIMASAIFRAIRNYKEDYEKSQHLNTK